MTQVISCNVSGLAGQSSDVQLSFDKELTVIFGMNGAGKTSILRLIASALKDDVSLIRKVPFDSAEVSIRGDGSKEPVTRTISSNVLKSLPLPPPLQLPAFVQGFLPPVQSQQGWISDSIQSPRLPFSCAYLSTFRIISNQFVPLGSESPYSEASVDQIFATQLLQTWQQYSNQALAGVRRLQENTLKSIVRSLFEFDEGSSHHSQLDIDQAFDETKQFLARQNIRVSITKDLLEDLQQERPHLAKIVDLIEKVERRIDEEDRPRQKLEELVQDLISNNKKVVFTDNQINIEVESGEVITPDLLSSGEKQLLRILVEVLGCGSNPILIDEPELSMHIDWQRVLVKSMRSVNPKAQIILATHSPDIMADVKDRNIVQI